VVGERHVAIIRSTIRLAAELGVPKLVTMSGNPGDGAGDTGGQLRLVPVAGRIDGPSRAAVGRRDRPLARPGAEARARDRGAGVRAPPAPPRLQRADLERMRDASARSSA
jgi:sugar phosphate isomerase/epimerase